MAIYISKSAAQKAGVEGDHRVVRWGDICHDREARKNGFYVDYVSTRNTSRWVCVERARPYIIRSLFDLDIIGSYKTLNGAVKAAERMEDQTNGR